MSPQKFVVRLLDEAGALLAWATVHAAPTVPHAPAASCPFHAPPTSFAIEQDGVASRIAVHWCALDVARVQALLEPVPVQAGQVYTFTWIEPVWLVPGMRDVPRPTVTVRAAPVQISVPVGQLIGRP